MQQFPKGLRSGATVDVLSAEGKWLARGAWSPDSQIRVRVWTFDPDEPVDDAFFKRRLSAANELRKSLPELSGCSAMRLVAAESDGLPGVTIDRYGQVLVMQLLSAGADRQRPKIVAALRSLFPDCSLLERSDVAIRAKEGLPSLVEVHHGDIPATVDFSEQGLCFRAGLGEGHKTGFYLDQRRNRARVAAYASGREVLNCFAYTGAMGVHCLKAGASHVTQVDVSSEALALARTHLELNELDPALCEFEQADVFARLRQYRAEGRKFDMVILDPPKFVESRQHLSRASRGYKDINLLALQLLRPGGILATFSCSGLMPEDLFRKIVADAALDAGRKLLYLERLEQAADHPVAAAFPEGWYLKGLICRVG